MSEEIRNRFATEGYAVVRGLVAKDAVELYWHYVKDRLTAGEYDFGDGQAQRWFQYKDPVGESLLSLCLPKLEAMTGLRLDPTYSYTAVYPAGADLEIHTDRGSCEVSVSVSIDHRDGDQPCEPWAFWVSTPDGEKELVLERGDAVLYRGCDVPHYRRPLGENRMSTAVFLHYVDLDGPLVEEYGHEAERRRRLTEAALAMAQDAGLAEPPGSSNEDGLKDAALQQLGSGGRGKVGLRP